MRRPFAFFVILAICALPLVAPSDTLTAAEWSLGNLTNLLKGTPKDIHCPQACDNCDKEFCVQRVPVRECVKGKKEVFDSKICYEYVAIPETRYRWKTRFICTEVKCPYCMPTCTTTDVNHCYETEHWESDYGDGCNCGEIHCKTCQRQVEKIPCKHCGRRPGETVVKVHYWSCVKEPYTVYRQVKRPVCVKQPRYEKVTVPITRYECQMCGGGCCDSCGGCGQCNKGGCKHCCE